MSVLERVRKCVPSAPRITIYGKPGVGKSTLASTFPKPLFLATEEHKVVGVDTIRIRDYDDIYNVSKELVIDKDLDFKTIVIDSVSKLDAMVIKNIVDKEDKAETIAASCGGYGAGFLKAQGDHRALKANFDLFQRRGITVIYVAHVTTKTYKSPEGDDYDIYSIEMHNDKSRQVYIDDVDAVLFCEEKSYVLDNAKKNRQVVKSSGKRVIKPGLNSVNVSKNRYNMPNEIPMSFEEIKKYIPFYNNNKGDKNEK